MSDPFSPAPDPGMYVARDSTEAALQEIVRQLRAGRPQVRLTGAPGMGKTLTLKLLPARLGGGWRLAHLPHPTLDAAGLWHWAATALGLARPTEAAVRRLAAEEARRGRAIVLAVDDANRMPRATRSALERACAQQPGLHCVLAEGTLERGPRDAISVASPLTLPELQAYVTARLDRAGAASSLRARFDAAALERLHRASAGVPQRVHQQIGRSLLREEWARSKRARPVAATEESPPATSAPPVAPSKRAARPVAEIAGPPAPAAAPAVPASRGEPRLRAVTQAAPPIPPRPEAAPGPVEAAEAAEAAEAGEAAEAAEAAEGAEAAEEQGAAERRRSGKRRHPRRIAGWTRLASAAAGDLRRRPLRWLAAGAAAACAAASFGLALRSSDGEGVYGTATALPPVAAPGPGAASGGVPDAAPPGDVRPSDLPEPDVPPDAAPPRREAWASPSRVSAGGEAAGAADVARGRLNVNALPWATIRVDGESIGETPLGEHAVPRGTHVIEARFPDGRVERREIELGPDDVYLVFR